MNLICLLVEWYVCNGIHEDWERFRVLKIINVVFQKKIKMSAEISFKSFLLQICLPIEVA